jgi:hypothetical protein
LTDARRQFLDSKQYPVRTNQFTEMSIQYLQDVAQTKILLSGSLKRFLLMNLGEAEDQRFELFEPEGRVFKSPGASLRFI